MVRIKKKIKKRTPSGRFVIRKRKRNPSFAKCANCGALLHGIPRLKPSELRKLPKSKRRPNRPYGGYLCSKCMRELFKSSLKEK